MTRRQTFGRRPGPQSPPPQAKPRAAASPSAGALADTIAFAEPSSADLPPPEWLSVDGELQEWKSARRRQFQLPWRQISLMAGLCFGVASLVLPDSINDVMQWPLYALTAASFYAGLRKKKISAAVKIPPTAG